ncbi:pseudouridine synthase [Sphingomonas sp. AP4-R1]|uniref:pseudouridine synthase n=1 Tax=Sphingomonas sp. AP4-R1 TaxID=2735134 RepID=UPI0014933688|nr:pseudouridine synthase [Sphingomonas sp. AP4-R1]QJU58606.1 pseudouridine synthase [Sphingomonas sp. AP4-R1]
MAEPQRIAKLLARAGVASRREIERMIEQRRIAIDGVPIETPATIVRSLAGVTVDGKPVDEPDHARLFLYHKPTGVLTAANDPAGRKTIYDRMPEGLPRVVPVGRLDLNTEGLLLLTTDGGLKRQLELPATGVERTYRARCYGGITQEQLESLSEGIEIDGIRYGSIDANLERRTGANQWIEMRLREGKNREVRRVLEYFGLEVNRLIRVSYGPFVLADLPVGGVVEVLQHDLVAFLKDLKNDPRMRSASEVGIPRTTPVIAATGPERGASRSARPVRATAGPRPIGSARPARAIGDKTRAAPAPGRAPRPRPIGAAPDARPTPASRPGSRDAVRPARPARAEIRKPEPEAPTLDQAGGARAAKVAKGKGWAKASRPTKRVGVGTGRNKHPMQRPDRPMTDQREDFNADPVARAPRSADPGGRPARGRPGGKDGAPPSRPGAPGRGPASRPPRPDKRR